MAIWNLTIVLMDPPGSGGGKLLVSVSLQTLNLRGTHRSPPMAGAIGPVKGPRSRAMSSIACDRLYRRGVDRSTSSRRSHMDHVTSKDGTSIAFDRQGRGPAVILVGGAFVDRSENAALATELAKRFTVYNYDRRGRGDSGDTPPYAVEREIEDLAAVIAAVGGEASVYGHSSGAGLALEAAVAGLDVDRLALYEP